MGLNWKLIGVSLIVVIIAILGLFYIVNNIASIMSVCEINKNLNICTLGSLPVIILVALLMIGGLIMIINVTAYILLTGKAKI